MGNILWSVDKKIYSDKEDHTLAITGWAITRDQSECDFILYGSGKELSVPEPSRCERADVAKDLKETKDIKEVGNVGFTVKIPEIIKLAEEHEKLQLALRAGDEKEIIWEAPQDAKIYREETDDTGVASFGKKDALSYNKVYCLREIKAPEGYVLDATPKYFAIAQKEGEAGEEIYPAQLTQWQKLGVEVYYLGATYKCNMYDSKGVLKVAKHFLDDKGKAITS